MGKSCRRDVGEREASERQERKRGETFDWLEAAVAVDQTRVSRMYLACILPGRRRARLIQAVAEYSTSFHGLPRASMCTHLVVAAARPAARAAPPVPPLAVRAALEPRAGCAVIGATNHCKREAVEPTSWRLARRARVGCVCGVRRG